MPNDPAMLLSFINTQLRDNYPSLSELCKAYMVEQDAITRKLEAIDYHYDKDSNQFT
jgi:hypothetical protein